MIAEQVVCRRFDAPDEVRAMERGTFSVIRLGGVVIGRAQYDRGWKWSEHVGPMIGCTHCTVQHVGLVLSGIAAVAFDDGSMVELRAGDVFFIPGVPHDSWVVGNEPYASLHLEGADTYAHGEAGGASTS
jgi:hypothetical protein